MVRELSTMMPAEGGYYHWVKKAFGPFAGFMAGWNNWVVSWLDVSIYPVFAAYYLSFFIPALSEGATIGGMKLSPDLFSWFVAVIIIWGVSLLADPWFTDSPGLFTNWLGVILMIPLFVMGFIGIYNWIVYGGPRTHFPAGWRSN